MTIANETDCFKKTKNLPMSAVMQRTCRRQRTTAKFKQGNIILSVCSVHSAVDETVEEFSCHERRGLVCVKVCVTQRHAAFPS